MFDKFKAMGALAGLMNNSDALREAAEKIKEEAKALRVTGEAGGGAVTVDVSGTMRVVSVHVEPALAMGFGDEANRAYAQQLIAEATNDGLERAQNEMREIIQRHARELGLPDIPADLGNLLQ